MNTVDFTTVVSWIDYIFRTIIGILEQIMAVFGVDVDLESVYDEGGDIFGSISNALSSLF